MMDEKRLEQEYRRLKRRQAPDLWNRIEENLREHPKRDPIDESLTGITGENQIEGNLQEGQEQSRRSEGNTGKALQRPEGRRIPLSRHQIYGLATAAAAMLALLIVVPGLTEGRFEKSGEETAPLMADQGVVAETMAGMARAGGMEAETEEAQMEADMAVPEAAPEAAFSGGNVAEAAKNAAEPGAVSNNGLTMASGAGESREQKERGRTAERLSDGVLSYEELNLAAYQPVALPQNAATAAADSMYFSEDILRDAQLLCSGTVREVSLEQNESGKAVKVAYEITLNQVYFAEGHTTGRETITVRSPIVRTEGDEAYILYQLQPGGTYLLPLCRQGQDWELLYPFAPQIQVTGDGAYLFHTGYASLVNEDTFVVIGSPEGRNDYFYDRMVLRDDENFLSELLTLIER